MQEIFALRKEKTGITRAAERGSCTRVQQHRGHKESIKRCEEKTS